MPTKHVREKAMHTTISSARLDGTPRLACARTDRVVNGPQEGAESRYGRLLSSRSQWQHVREKSLLAEGHCAPKLLDLMPVREVRMNAMARQRTEVRGAGKVQSDSHGAAHWL